MNIRAKRSSIAAWPNSISWWMPLCVQLTNGVSIGRVAPILWYVDLSTFSTRVICVSFDTHITPIWQAESPRTTWYIFYQGIMRVKLMCEIIYCPLRPVSHGAIQQKAWGWKFNSFRLNNNNNGTYSRDDALTIRLRCSHNVITLTLLIEKELWSCSASALSDYMDECCKQCDNSEAIETND